MNDIWGKYSVFFAKQMSALLVRVLNRLYITYVTASYACTHNEYNIDIRR
jgi:hypothetical protein